MSQPFFSKHLRIKANRTPILEELLSYSRHSSTPKQHHVDKIVKVWRNFPGNEQCYYKHIPDMSISLSRYLVSTRSMQSSPIVKSKKFKLSTRGRNNRLSKPSSTPNLYTNSAHTKSKDSLSPETKNIAISLNKHKLEEVSLRPKYMQEAHIDKDAQHKLVCDCCIREIEYQNFTMNHIGEHQLFISCKYAASDLPALLQCKIHAILTIGESPKCSPSIKGGYCTILFDGVMMLKALNQATRFLNAKLKVGNVLIHCEDGNKLSIMMAMAYLLRETGLPFRLLSEIFKKLRPNYCLTLQEELYVKYYDRNR